MISCENGYIEIMEYPRADKAVIVDAETGEKTEISCGDTSDALLYERWRIWNMQFLHVIPPAYI